METRREGREPRSPGSEPEPPGWLEGGRIPGLDGMRAISIVLVMVSHVVATRGWPGPKLSVHDRRFGGLGVDVFFVISGFLITLLLFREMKKTGKVALGAFYARRALRILPAYVAYLAFVGGFHAAGHIHLRAIDWIAAGTYTVNFLGDLSGLWPLGHIWSLSIEEHFYLVWPVVLAFLGRKAAFRVLVAVIACGPFLRLWCWGVGLDVNTVTPARIDTIGMGCLLAYIAESPRSWPIAAKMGRWGGWVVLAAVIGLMISAGPLAMKERYSLTIERTVEASLIAAIVFAGVSMPGSRFGRFLEWKPIAAVGVMSYSFYLWQQVFLNPTSGRAMCRWPMNLIWAVVTARASFVLIERPFLRLKGRFSAEKRPIPLPRPHATVANLVASPTNV